MAAETMIHRRGIANRGFRNFRKRYACRGTWWAAPTGG